MNEKKIAPDLPLPDCLDEGIRDAVMTLVRHGFKTIESCSGEEGHAYKEPMIRFYGDHFDLLRAFDILLAYGFPAKKAMLVFSKEPVYDERDINNIVEVGETISGPYVEIIFRANPKCCA